MICIFPLVKMLHKHISCHINTSPFSLIKPAWNPKALVPFFCWWLCF